MESTIKAAELARILNAHLLGPGDVPLQRLDALDQAREGSVTFIRSNRYAPRWHASRASAAIITKTIPLSDLVPDFDPEAPASPRPLLIVPDADLAVYQAAELFAPPITPPAVGVHPAASVHPSATTAPTASIGPGCVVMAGAVIADGAVLSASVFVGRDAMVGERSLLSPHVAIMDRCTVGSRCILHAGVVVGADGFGFRPSPDGRGIAKIIHIGNAVIEDEVEIGANSCIDRARFGSTIIGRGTKIDNLVQIGHNCRVGRFCLICGHVGLAGSVVLGDGVALGGKVGVADDVEIGAGAKVAALSGVTGDVPPGAVYMGNPAGPASEWRRTFATLRRIGKRQVSKP